ncbi:MAG: hypothetical protein CMC15_16715 [Flavobacteriaceae bacterium]|nr:hypothetical protein [Flavobacteriaceae bacterium]
MKTENNLLKFSNPNAKIPYQSFSIPAGYSCPGALNCLTKVKGGKIVDLQKPDADGLTYRCYAASLEAVYPSLNAKLNYNFKLLKEAKSFKEMTALIARSLPPKLRADGGALRVHIHGDFYSLDYLRAWFAVAEFFPSIRFYSYTKSLNFLQQYKSEKGQFPFNYSLTWSHGSKFDHLGPELGIKSVRLVKDQEEAFALGLDIDHDDSHAIHGEKDFALEPHGTQPAGHPLQKIILAKRKAGKFAGYSK